MFNQQLFNGSNVQSKIAWDTISPTGTYNWMINDHSFLFKKQSNRFYEISPQGPHFVHIIHLLQQQKMFHHMTKKTPK